MCVSQCDRVMSLQEQSQIWVLVPLDNVPEEVIKVVEFRGIKVLLLLQFKTSILKGHGMNRYTEHNSHQKLADVHYELLPLASPIHCILVPLFLQPIVRVVIQVSRFECLLTPCEARGQTLVDHHLVVTRVLLLSVVSFKIVYIGSPVLEHIFKDALLKRRMCEVLLLDYKGECEGKEE